jgi:hypothetical protein
MQTALTEAWHWKLTKVKAIFREESIHDLCE